MIITLRVILIDEEQWCLEELKEILERLSWVEIVGAYLNAKEGLDAIIRDKPDFVFTDVQMSGMSGLEIARKIKRLQSKIAIILVSDNKEYAREGFDIGVNDYILKPVRKERIRKALTRVR